MDTGSMIKTITQNRKYYVSTIETWDRGWETLVFRYDNAANAVTDFGELDSDAYNSKDEAYEGHKALTEKWEKM